jgi:hypothetical protein
MQRYDCLTGIDFALDRRALRRSFRPKRKSTRSEHEIAGDERQGHWFTTRVKSPIASPLFSASPRSRRHCAFDDVMLSDPRQ